MRAMRIITIFFSVLAFVSCKSKNKTTQTEAPTVQNVDVKFVTPPIHEEGEQIPTDNSTLRLQVSFYSIGAGIDGENKDKFDLWLKGLSKQVKYEETHWGREGEVNYCFTLVELNAKEQEKFIADTKAQLSKSTLVHINENANCDKKK